MLAHLIRYLDHQQLYTLLGILAAFRAIFYCHAWDMIAPLLGTIGWAMLHKLSRAYTWVTSLISRADFMQNFEALLAMRATQIQGFDVLRGSMMIIISTDGIKCAPDLVQPLHNWLFKGGEPPKDWADIQVFQFQGSAADQHVPFHPFLNFPV